MILDLLNNTGLTPRRTASTNGGEYHSPCPGCGGDDRFAAWPEQGEHGRYWCRVCDKKGDAIQFLMDFQGMTFKEAAGVVGKPLSLARNNAPRKIKQIPPKPEPPSDMWVGRVTRLVEDAHGNLLKNRDKIRWLKNERGISLDTVKRHHLGWLSKDHYRTRVNWSLKEDIKPNGKPKKLFIPSGLIIPYLVEKPVRIRVRRDNPGEWGRYYILPGSSSEPMVIFPQGDAVTNPMIIVESELDAILLSQELKSPYSIIALGFAQAKPHDELVLALHCAPYIIVCLDADIAGNKATRYWCETYQNAVWFPMLLAHGKDPTEAYLNGLDLNLWLEAACMAVTELGK